MIAPDPHWTIEPSTVPGYWNVRRDGFVVKDDAGLVRMFGSAAAASNWIDATQVIA